MTGERVIIHPEDLSSDTLERILIDLRKYSHLGAYKRTVNVLQTALEKARERGA